MPKDDAPQADLPEPQAAPSRAPRAGEESAGLAAGEGLLRAIAEGTSDAIYVKDREGRYRLVNAAACELLGLTREEILGRDDTALFAADEARRIMDSDCQVMAADACRTYEERVIVRGELRTFLSAKGPWHDPQGRVAGLFGITRDITERRRVEEALERSEERLRSIMDHVPDTFMQVDADGRIQFVNRLGPGRAAEQLIGTPVEDWFPEGQRAVVRTALAAALTTGQCQAYQSLGPGPDGAPHAYDVRVLPVIDRGAVQSAIFIASDITERKAAEEQAELLRRSIDVHFDGAYWFGTDNRFIYVNQAGCRALGYELEQLLQMTVSDVNPRATPERLRQVWEQLRRVGSLRVESAHRRRDGSEFPVEIVTSYVRCGAREYACGFARDISERRQAERALRESEQRFATVFRSAPVLMAIATLADGVVVDVNDAVLQASGYTREELVGRTAVELGWLSADDRRRLLQAVQERGRVDGLEATFHAKDGRAVFGLVHTEKIELDGRECLLSVVIDVTERLHAEEEARAGAERFRALIEHSHDAVTLLAADGTVLYDSPSVARVLGYGPEERVGRPVFEFVHPDERDVMASGFARFAERHGAVMASTARFLHKDGSYRDIEGVRTNLLHVPAIRAVVVNYRDVTEARRAEEERRELERRLLHAQKLESLGVLAGGIAHDFNNLLMGIQASLDLALLDIAPGAAARVRIEQAIQATRRATDLTRQMLAYSGKGRFVVKLLDLAALVRENADLLRTVVAHTATLEVSSAATPALVEADPGQVQQVVMNLITNASEALAGQPGVITLRTGVTECRAAELARSRVEPRPDPGRFVCVEVADTGCGMDDQTQMRLFEPFFTTKFTGRGLGMAAVLGIVRGHKGAILVDSAPGRGTTVRVLLPAVERRAGDAPMVGGTVSSPRLEGSARGREPAIRPTGSPSLEGSARGREPAISPTGLARAGLVLVVDDEEAVRTPCRELVERLGYASLAAASGAEAVALLQERRDEIVCVLLDLTMPHMDGVATFHELTRVKPDVAVILSSGFSEEAALEEFGARRPAGFIQKPYRLETLRAVLASVVAG